jgi:hypothetical protein
MIAHIAKLVAVALPLAALAACSSSTDSGPGTSATIPAAFSKYCSATLKTEQKVMNPMGPGAWMGTGEKVPAGTKILLSEDFSAWGGYAIKSDGGPLKISAADRTKGLVKDVDFTSDCAPAAVPKFGDATIKTVTLAKATFYATKELTGTACTLEAGTEFSNYGITGGGDVSEVFANQIKEKCSLDKAYSKDLLTGGLVLLPAS